MRALRRAHGLRWQRARSARRHGGPHRRGIRRTLRGWARRDPTRPAAWPARPREISGWWRQRRSRARRHDLVRWTKPRSGRTSRHRRHRRGAWRIRFFDSQSDTRRHHAPGYGRVLRWCGRCGGYWPCRCRRLNYGWRSRRLFNLRLRLGHFRDGRRRFFRLLDVRRGRLLLMKQFFDGRRQRGGRFRGLYEPWWCKCRCRGLGRLWLPGARRRLFGAGLRGGPLGEHVAAGECDAITGSSANASARRSLMTARSSCVARRTSPTAANRRLRW